MLRRVFNTTTVTSFIAGYVAEGLSRKFLIKDEKQRLRFNIENTSRWSRRALQQMGCEIEVVGFDDERFRNNNYLFVCNHMSYIDILVTCSVKPMVFVTSVDMGELPFLGDMAALGGSIFVERRHRGEIEKDIGNMTNALKDGFDVMIYPEGTSTDGSQMLPFKKSLLMSAVFASKDIQPVCLKYTEIDGKPFSRENADTVCWYGDMSFPPHFFKIFGVKSLKAELVFLDPIRATPESDRTDLANQAYEAIATEYFGKPTKAPAKPAATAESNGA